MNPPPKTTRWGIVGLGAIAHEFVRDLLLLPHTTIAAVASRTLDKAQRFARQYGVDKAYGSYAELFADPAVDIVYIATPHNSHETWSIAAMRAGKHVLCEKPLAVNQRQVQNMIDVARQQEVFMMEAFWSRFNPSIRAVLSLIRQGAIGEVNYVNVDFSVLRETPAEHRMVNKELAGGSLLELGVYPCFLVYMIFGQPMQVLATARLHQTGADMQTAALFKYPNGLCTILSGFASQSDMIAKIYGSKGRIYLNAVWHETQGYTLIREGEGGGSEQKTVTLPTQGKGFTYEIQECLDCIAQGRRESLLWSHQNSLDLIGITDEIRCQTGLTYPFEQEEQ